MISTDSEMLHYVDLVLLNCSETRYFSVTDFVYDELEDYIHGSALPVMTALLNLGYVKKSDSGSEYVALTQLGREVRKAGGHAKYEAQLESNKKRNSLYTKISLITAGIAVIVSSIFSWLQYSTTLEQNKKIEQLETEINVLKKLK